MSKLFMLIICVISGYKEIFVIPASATNINIQELAPSSNFLGKDDLGHILASSFLASLMPWTHRNY